MSSILLSQIHKFVFRQEIRRILQVETSKIDIEKRMLHKFFGAKKSIRNTLEIENWNQVWSKYKDLLVSINPPKELHNLSIIEAFINEVLDLEKKRVYLK